MPAHRAHFAFIFALTSSFACSVEPAHALHEGETAIHAAFENQEEPALDIQLTSALGTFGLIELDDWYENVADPNHDYYARLSQFVPFTIEIIKSDCDAE